MSSRLSAPSGTGLALIDKQVLSSSTGTFTFSPIPSIYSSLYLTFQARSDALTTAVNMRLQFNADTGANYDWCQVLGLGNAASSNGAIGASFIVTGGPSAASATAGVAGLIEVIIPNYAGTTFQKAVRCTYAENFGNAIGSIGIGVIAGFWRSTSAITRVDCISSGSNWIAGSTAVLYGLP